MSRSNDVISELFGIFHSVSGLCVLAFATILLSRYYLSLQQKHRVPPKLPTHLVLVAASCPQRISRTLLHLRELRVPFVTVVGLTLHDLAPYLPEMTELPAKRGDTHVEFSWNGAHAGAQAPTSRFRWMRAEDGRARLANRLKHLIISNENVMNVLSDPWPLPCLAVVESTAACLNGTDTLPIRQADLHFVSRLNVRSVAQCLCSFAKGEQRFGK